jgi:hypothetical protein
MSELADREGARIRLRLSERTDVGAAGCTLAYLALICWWRGAVVLGGTPHGWSKVRRKVLIHEGFDQ